MRRVDAVVCFADCIVGKDVNVEVGFSMHLFDLVILLTPCL